MKVCLVNKKFIFLSFLLIIFFILGILFVYRTYPDKIISTFEPIDNSKEYILDLDGDGIIDSLKVVKNNSKPDIKITTNAKSYYLSDNCENSFISTDFFPMKVYIFETIRNDTPIIVIQCNNTINIFSWNKTKFSNLIKLDGNIFGILNSKNSKTPVYYAFTSSKGMSTLNSYMLINKESLNVSKELNSIDGISNIISFIDLIEKSYEIEDLPDIFSTTIDTSNLAILFNLDKEHNTYSFQNAFFYDESFDEEDNSIEIKWRLSFEKFTKDGTNSSKEEKVIYVSTSKNEDGSFKISNISL